MRKRLWIAGPFAVLASLPLFLLPTGAQPGIVKAILPGVWFQEGDLQNMGHCNNIIIEMKDYLIVVDANFPSGARLALEGARSVSKKPVRYVFDTHHHGDHAYGNPVWTKAGATTLAYKGVTEEMKRYEPARWQAAAKERKDVAELNLPMAEPPKQTFDKSPFVLKDETREVQFHFFGWAHTRGDGFVYLPKEKVLCTGDAVVNGPYNYTADANIGNWPAVVRAAQKLDVTMSSRRMAFRAARKCSPVNSNTLSNCGEPSRRQSSKGKNSRISSDQKPRWSLEFVSPHRRPSACLTACKNGSAIFCLCR